MKIGLYNPYFDSLSGGERYVLTLASHWSKTHEVDIFWNDPSILIQAQNRFSIDLSAAHVVPNIFLGQSLFSKFQITRNYDCIFLLSDGSVPMTFARHNILHFQVPFKRVSMPWWKKSQYQRIVVNSEFTNQNLDPALSLGRSVIYPPVDVEHVQIGVKKKSILSVGRFSSLYGAKKQDILIEVFKKISNDAVLKNWSLSLAGGLMPSDEKYFQHLKRQAEGFPVEFFPNCSFDKLHDLYKDASLYWHAAGYGETEPEHMEHFGITTVESMVAGCVPIVFRGGGQPEIINHSVSGFLWNTTDELAELTLDAVKSEATRKQIQKSALMRAKDFSLSKFSSSFDRLLNDICQD